ncbi:uncharacterized protein LOC144133101 isoform X1 [Amblyomma americanum]
MPAMCARRRVLLLVIRTALQLIVRRRQERRQRRRHRWWVRPVFVARRQEGRYHPTMRRMREGDHEFFRKFFRMTPVLFDEVLGFVLPDLTRQHVVREPLEPGERLAIALSKPTGAWRDGTDWLDAGDSWRDGSDSWRDGSGSSVTTSCTSDACDAQTRRHSSNSMMVSDGSGALLCWYAGVLLAPGTTFGPGSLNCCL